MAKEKKEMTEGTAKIRAGLGIVLGAAGFLMLAGFPLFFVGVACAVGALVCCVPLTKQPVRIFQVLGIVGIVITLAAAGVVAFSGSGF